MARGGAVLYTPEILALAVDLARFPYAEASAHRGEAQSRICGSRIAMSLGIDTSRTITTIGARVSACAIGQAAATLFLRAAAGRSGADIATAQEQIEAWLSASGPEPDWPNISMLASALAFPARHQAILLPWKAALAALSNPARPD